VSQGTIEEKVLALHEHKRRLADAVLAGVSEVAAVDRDSLEELI
jgi:SNF2 family DNA or RNA helicase